ncbi:hypothetical protein [Caulobacter sp. DWR2-3-1b2]|uniref:hypothetical protein n=1 Tax=Caulobacter sp. DWR2-3-1b2 TaxID=2804642 RepID=UPI003CEAF4B3
MAEENVENPTVEEFSAWLIPAAALVALPDLAPEMAVRTILGRAKSGLVVAAASAMTWSSQGEQKTAKIVTIDPNWWDKAGGHIDETWSKFWHVGDMDVHIRDRMGSLVVNLFDVRFEPFGIHAISGGLIVRSASTIQALIAAPSEPEAGSRRETPSIALERSVSEGQLKAWAKTYLASRPGMVHDEIAEAASKHFHPRTVTRRPLRSAIKLANYPVRVGKPSKNRNKPAN